jgi:6-phosphogluconolactonase
MCWGALLMAGCGGDFFQSVNNGSSGSGSGGSGSGGGSTTTTGYLYVGNSASTTLAGFGFDSSGALSAVTNSPYNLNFNVTSIAVTPNNAFLYIGTQGFIYVYSISNGALTLGNNGSPVATIAPGGMKVDPSGKWLLVADAFNFQVDAFAIDTSTGALTSTTSTLGLQAVTSGVTSPTPSDLLVTPNGAYVYVSLGTAGLNIFTLNSSTGALTFTGTLASRGTQNSDLGMASDSNSQFLFMAETNTGLRVFTISTNGALSEVSGSPFTTGTGPHAVAIDPTNNFVYVANLGGNSISGFSLASTTGALTALSGSPYATGASPVGLTFDQSKTYLAVICNGSSPDLQIFKLDSTTPGAATAGQLDSVTTISTGPSNAAGNPISLAATRFQ